MAPRFIQALELMDSFIFGFMPYAVKALYMFIHGLFLLRASRHVFYIWTLMFRLYAFRHTLDSRMDHS